MNGIMIDQKAAAPGAAPPQGPRPWTGWGLLPQTPLAAWPAGLAGRERENIIRTMGNGVDEGW